MRAPAELGPARVGSRESEKRYQIRLRPETHRKLKAEAARRGISLSQLADEKLSRL